MTTLMQAHKVIRAYWRARRLRFADRRELEQHQLVMLDRLLRLVPRYSPYYRAYGGAPLRDWPVMNKHRMLDNFGAINTAGLALDEVWRSAIAAEQSRDFETTLRCRARGYTVGLSSGTCGRRGVFVVSDHERATWAGTLLAKALPGGLLVPNQRVALLLRANSNLYETVRMPWLRFKYFDLFKPFDDNLKELAEFRPTVVVAPAQVLREMALRKLSWRAKFPFQAISVAEVLDTRDRLLIECEFGKVQEIYQATEGLLATTCREFRLHLMEEYVHVEPEWLPDASDGKRRFIPVITDFSRLTQPVIRYRLDDVLVLDERLCTCGSATRVIESIEGRSDDVLVLPTRHGPHVPVFADLVSRVLAVRLPPEADYQLVQANGFTLTLHTNADVAVARSTMLALADALARQGVDVAVLKLDIAALPAVFSPTTKRRRIVRLRASHG